MGISTNFSGVPGDSNTMARMVSMFAPFKEWVTVVSHCDRRATQQGMDKGPLHHGGYASLREMVGWEIPKCRWEVVARASPL